MADTPRMTVELNLAEDDEHAIAALQAAVELAEQARALLDRFPPDLNPLVVARQQLAPVQAAVDAFDEAVLKLAPAAAQETTR